jgi:hypothetical protein
VTEERAGLTGSQIKEICVMRGCATVRVVCCMAMNTGIEIPPGNGDQALAGPFIGLDGMNWMNDMK